MTTPPEVRMAAGLAPVRAEILRAAREEADNLRAEARAAAAELLERAAAEADRILAEARDRGAAEGEKARTAQLLQVRRAARGAELAAHREAWEELRRRVASAASALREDPAYPRRLDRLTGYARAVAGEGAASREPAEGGVVAEAPGRWVDCTLPALATAALEGLGPEVETLWGP